MPSACDSLIDDIEDMVTSSEPTLHDRLSARKSIVPRSRKKKDLSTEELQTDRYVNCLTLWQSSVVSWYENKYVQNMTTMCILLDTRLDKTHIY